MANDTETQTDEPQCAAPDQDTATEPAPASEHEPHPDFEPPHEATGPAPDFDSNHPPTPAAPRGTEAEEVVAGTAHAVENGDTVVVELPGTQQGVIPAAAFEKLPRIGTRLEFVVELGAADDKGRLRLHLPDPDERITWKNLEQGMAVDAMVTGMNTGGLELKIAGSKIRAFMPSSQIDLTPVEDPTPLLNHKLHCKVISLEKRRRRVVLSRRAVLEREHRKLRLKQIKRGEEFEGKVRKIEEFGVFVDLEPGLDGLVHLADLSWRPFHDPAEVVQVGQTVRVKVLRVERGRLSLGIRQTQPDPWDEAEKKYPAGSKVRGKVVRTADFGAFVELEPGIEGMIHISQLSDRRVEKVEHVAREGQSIDAKVMEIDPRKQRISLSVRALTHPESAGRAAEASRDEIRKYVKPADKAKAVESLMAKWGGGSGLKGGIG